MSAPNLEEISRHAAIDDRRLVVEQLREDFKFMFFHWRRIGDLSELECRQQMKEAGAAISQMDHGMTAKTAEYFAGLVKRVRNDEARSREIAQEVKSSRRKAA